MADAWLPYAASALPSPPYQRPPAFSLQPAVAIPLLPAAALAAAMLWAFGRPTALQPSTPPDSAPAEVRSSPVFPLPAAVNVWAPQIGSWASAYDLPPELVAVVMTIESCGDPNAVSRAGALGLFQVMPFHFSPDEAPLDPQVNARRGLSYLRRALQLAGGDVGLALAGYNGGHGVIGRPRSAWPDETLRYVTWGTGILEDLQAGRSPSPGLQAWLDAGGSHLCRRAEGGD